MCGSRSANRVKRRPLLHRAEHRTRSFANSVTSPPLPVPRPGSRAAGSPPRAGRTFLWSGKARDERGAPSPTPDHARVDQGPTRDIVAVAAIWPAPRRRVCWHATGDGRAQGRKRMRRILTASLVATAVALLAGSALVQLTGRAYAVSRQQCEARCDHRYNPLNAAKVDRWRVYDARSACKEKCR
jgi:hypothetical protein